MEACSRLLIACIHEGEITISAYFVNERMSGEIEKNKVAWLCHVHTKLRDKGFRKLRSGLGSKNKLQVRRSPIASLELNQPFCGRACIIFGECQRSKMLMFL